MSHNAIYLLIIIIVVLIMIGVACWLIQQQKSDYNLYFTNNTSTKAELKIEYTKPSCSGKYHTLQTVYPGKTVKVTNPEVRVNISFTSKEAFNQGIHIEGIKFIGRHNYVIYPDSFTKTLYPDENISSSISITQITVNNYNANAVAVNLGTLSNSQFTLDTTQQIQGTTSGTPTTLNITDIFELAAVEAKNTPCGSSSNLAYQLFIDNKQVSATVPFTITASEVVINYDQKGDGAITGSGFTICSSS